MDRTADSVSANVAVGRYPGDRQGQGLCIPLSPDEFLVLTCHHVFEQIMRDERMREDGINVDFYGMRGQNLRRSAKATYDRERSDPEHDVAILRFYPDNLALRMPPIADHVKHRDRVVAPLRPNGSFEADLGLMGLFEYTIGARRIVVEAWPLLAPNQVEDGISGAPVALGNGDIVGLISAARPADARNEREAYAIPINAWLDLDRELRAVRPAPPSPLLSMFQGKVNASAACCAELAGDGTVLVTGTVLLAKLDIYVHVAIEPARVTTFKIFGPKGGVWDLAEPDVVRRFTDTFGPIFDARPHRVRSQRQALIRKYLEARYLRYLGSYSITVVFEVPIGIGILEESAFAVALSRALIKLNPAPLENEPKLAPEISDEEGLAGLLLGVWHTHMSWGTIVGSSKPDLVAGQLLLFERESSTDVPSLLVLYRDPTLLAIETQQVFGENAVPARRFWMEQALDIEGKISIWYRDGWLPPLCQLPNPKSNFRKAAGLKKLQEASKVIAAELRQEVVDLDDDSVKRIGLLMQCHQLILELAGMVDGGVHHELAKINGSEAVLGAKLACARGSGAVVVLTKQYICGIPPDGFHDLSNVLQRFDR